MAAAAGRRKRKIFPSTNLANNEQDKLHVEIYWYFRWLWVFAVAFTVIFHVVVIVVIVIVRGI